MIVHIGQRLGSTKLLDVACKLRLEVRSLVLVNDVHLCKLVEHLLYGGVHRLGLSLVCCCTQFTHSSAHSLCIVAVVEATLLLLADSLE